MRQLVIGMVMLCSTSLFAQSKKELVAEVAALKSKIEELKKPVVVELNDKHKIASYGLGVLVAQNLKAQGGDSLSLEAITEGINDIFNGKSPRYAQEEMVATVNEYMQIAMQRTAEKIRDKNAQFLIENRTKEGVVTTGSGLQYKVINSGKGKMPKATDNVTVHYAGKLIDGTPFDSSIERNEPATFDVNGVIAGWTEALQLMHEGDKWMLYIPYPLAYGEQGAGGGQIPPYATLIFEVELLKVN